MLLSVETTAGIVRSQNFPKNYFNEYAHYNSHSYYYYYYYQFDSI